MNTAFENVDEIIRIEPMILCQMHMKYLRSLGLLKIMIGKVELFEIVCYCLPESLDQ